MVIAATGSVNDVDVGLPEWDNGSRGASVLYCVNASLLTINGISGAWGNFPCNNMKLWIVSIGAGRVDIADQNTGSTAEKRIITGVAGPVSLAAGSGCAQLVYDGNTARWRVVVKPRTLISTLTDGATPALDASLTASDVSGVFRLAAAGDRTIAVPTNATDGQKIVIEHFASGGARTLSLNTGVGGFRFGSDISSLSQTASGKTDYIGCLYNGTDSRWDVVAVTKGF